MWATDRVVMVMTFALLVKEVMQTQSKQQDLRLRIYHSFIPLF